MTKRVQMVLVCEDSQHRVFARRFLRAMGWNIERLRIEAAPPGLGAGDQFVKVQYTRELKGLRQGVALLTMLDGDATGLAGRRRELDNARVEAGLSVPDPNQVFVFVPTWNIETWLEYLDGSAVDESKPDYPRLKRERECQRHVDGLASMCRTHELRDPAPSTLLAACVEYERFAANH